MTREQCNFYTEKVILIKKVYLQVDVEVTITMYFIFLVGTYLILSRGHIILR